MSCNGEFEFPELNLSESDKNWYNGIKFNLDHFLPVTPKPKMS